MAPSFLKELRRRSRASFRTDRSTDSSIRSSESTPTTKSSSTLNSTYGSRTPPSVLHSSNSSSSQVQALLPPPTASRPQPASSPLAKRVSVNGMSGLGPQGTGNPALPMSPLVPRITSVCDGVWVHQKIISIYGTIGDPTKQALDGVLVVSRLDDDLPPTHWPVCESFFKALVYLNPGPNKLRLDFSPPKLANSNNANAVHSSYININMMPGTNTPPLQLVILLGKDSTGSFDAVPSRAATEGNNLETAITKFRMAAYLWQTFTAEQMSRNRLGRRSFRFEEEWQTGTITHRDRELSTMRNEAKIHIVRSDKTVAEIRDLGLAQRNQENKSPNGLFNIAGEAVKNYFKPLPSQKLYASVLLLDSHWDPEMKIITGHAALGGEYEGISLAIFGSHALQSYPTSIEEVVPAFTDCTRTDTRFVANEYNEAGSSWEAANIGIGGHLHEVGHLFGCTHRENGIMQHDYVNFNRSFTIREPFSTRINSKGSLILPKDECGWHRLDCLRFRCHPCFKLPHDAASKSDDTITVWSVDDGKVIVTANTGVSFIEIFAQDNDACHAWIEYGDGNGNGPLHRLVVLTEQDLRNRLAEDQKKNRLSLSIKSYGGGSQRVEDFTGLNSKFSHIKLSNGQMGFRGAKVGLMQVEKSEPDDIIFHSAVSKTKLLTLVRVYHDVAVRGIEFVYEDTSSQLLGKSEGVASDFSLDVRRGEFVLGFYLRSSFRIDGIQILTSAGRKSDIFGNITGGSPSTFIPPRGYSLAGISGICSQWIDGFSVIITR